MNCPMCNARVTEKHPATGQYICACGWAEPKIVQISAAIHGKANTPNGR